MIIERIQTPLQGVVFDTSLRKESGISERERVTAADDPTNQKQKRPPYRGFLTKNSATTSPETPLEDSAGVERAPGSLDITA
jgi:hypothetical protein